MWMNDEYRRFFSARLLVSVDPIDEKVVEFLRPHWGELILRPRGTTRDRAESMSVR